MDPNGGFIYSAYVDDWIMSTVETGIPGDRRLVDHGPLHATVAWPSWNMEAPLVRGSPYVTVYYSGSAPRLTTVHAIISVNGVANGGTVPDDTRFEVALDSGDLWIVYTQELVSFAWTRGEITAAAPLNSAVRYSAGAADCP